MILTRNGTSYLDSYHTELPYKKSSTSDDRTHTYVTQTTQTELQASEPIKRRKRPALKKKRNTNNTQPNYRTSKRPKNQWTLFLSSVFPNEQTLRLWCVSFTVLLCLTAFFCHYVWSSSAFRHFKFPCTLHILPVVISSIEDQSKIIFIINYYTKDPTFYLIIELNFG